MNAFERYVKAARETDDTRWRKYFWEKAVEQLDGEPPDAIAARVMNAVQADRMVLAGGRNGK
jgi:hypothetical protein